MSGRCIYCGEQKPFTAEHVVSAGVGGDDPDWLLTDCVCGDCNTKVFSPLETKAFRNSPLALSRIFLQPQTRTRTGKPSTPSIQPRADYHVDEATGIRFEQVLRAGGQPVMLPQIALGSDGNLIVNLPNVDEGNSFFDTMRTLLTDRIILVKKAKDGVEVRFDQTELVWLDDNKNYEPTGNQKSEHKPPRGPNIWIEDIEWPGDVTVGDFSKMPPRVFRREKGQICCRVADDSMALGLLSVLKNEIGSLAIPPGANSITSKSKTSQKYAFDMKAYDRVIAKIGFNLCAKLYGPDFVRQGEFDNSREYIRSGSGDIHRKIVTDESDGMANACGPPLKDHHVLMIAAFLDQASGKQFIVLISRLYGGPVELRRLAEFPTKQSQLKDIAVVVVEYTSDQIRDMSLPEFTEFAANHSAVPLEEYLDKVSHPDGTPRR